MGWSGYDDSSAAAGLRRAFELGINLFDTADVYGHGHSERLVGDLVADVGRDDLIIASKVGYLRGSAAHAYDPANLRHQLHTTLRNLKTDFVDLYSFHNSEFGTDDARLDDAVATMQSLRDAGLIRAIGMRGPHRFALERTAAYRGQRSNKRARFFDLVEYITPDVVQVRYNMLTPNTGEPINDVFAWARLHDVGVLITKPLAQGLLLDKYDPERPPVFEPGDHRERKRWYAAPTLRVLRTGLHNLQSRFGYGTDTLAGVALQYCLQRHDDACVLVGFRTASQVEQNVRSVGRFLSEDDLAFIDLVMTEVRKGLGSFFEENE